MASATVEVPSGGLHVEALPLIDLRLLSQSELHALSLTSASAAADLRRCDDVVIPKIDRSVFNESAGSRKQTYSRLRLAPRKPEISSTAATTISRRISKSHSDHAAAADDTEREENLKIVGLLKELFAAETKNRLDDDLVPIPVEYGESVPQSSNVVLQTVAVDVTDVAGGGVMKRKRGRPRKYEKAIVVCENIDNGECRDRERERDMDREILNENGVVVDAACLANSEDPFGPELKRRTEGMETEVELLGFLTGLEGQWGSRRKKRKIVEASDFGDALPKGWKLLLSLKKKEGHAWLICRRYISPNGRQFMSCKEVSSYLLSIVGPQGASQPDSGHSNESIQLLHNISSGNVIQQTADITFKGDNKRDDLACHSPPPVTSMSTDHEKQVTLFKVANQGEIQAGDIFKCHKCSSPFDAKDDLLQHLLSCHKRKRRKLGSSVSDGVIINDGKYECQFCHKIFHERHRYNGHVGIHVKSYVKSVEASSGVIAMQKSEDHVFLGEVPPRVSEMQISITTNVDSIAKPYNTTANNCLNSGFPNSKLKAASTVETYPEKCSHELTSLSQGRQDMMVNKNDKFVVDESSDNHDRDIKMANDKLGKVDKATDIVPAELNCTLGAETALSNNDGNSLCETLDGTYVPKCTTSRCGQERSSESCLRAFSGNEQTWGPDNNMNGVSIGLMKKPKQDIGFESGLDEDVVAEFKQQGNPENCSFANEQKCGFGNNVTGVFTSIMAESKEESSSERGVLTLPNDEQAYGADSNGNDVSARKLDEIKFDEMDNPGNKEPMIGFESSHAGQDEDAVTSIEQERNSEMCLLVPSWNEQEYVVDNTVNRVSTCTMAESLKEKGSEGNLLTLSGNEQTYGVDKNVNKVSTSTMEELEINEINNSRNSELVIAFHGSQSGLDIDFVTSFEEEIDSGGYSLVPPGDEQTFGVQDNVTEFCNNKEEEPKQERVSESGLLISSGHEHNDKNNVKKVSNNAMEDPKLDEVRNSWNSNLIFALGSGHTGLDADVGNRSFESCSPVFSVNEQTFGAENNGTGIYNSVVEEPEQKRDSESSLLGHFGNENTCVENNLNRVFTGTVWEGHRPETVENSRNNERMIHFGNNRPRPNGEVVADAMWRTDQGNVLQTGLADSSLPVVQSSGRFPTFDFISDKGENELFSVSQKFDSISGFEGMRSGSIEQLEYSFLTARTNPIPEDSKVLSYDAEMEQGFDSSVWIGREALLPKIVIGNQSTALCVWCRNEFHHEAVDSGVQTGSIGPLCPTCKAKISAQLNVF